jgi:hypothetical protein
MLDKTRQNVFTIDYEPARQAVAILWQNVTRVCAARHHHDIPYPHTGPAFEEAAIRYAERSYQIGLDCDPHFREAARKVTDICAPGWERDPVILGLWHRVALVGTHFSDHPTKRVFSLIINEFGEMEAYAPNRMPEGVALEDVDHSAGIGARHAFRLCSEREACVRRFGMKLELPDLKEAPPSQRRQQTRQAIKNLSDNIFTAGLDSNVRDRVLVSTIPTCKSCAAVLPPIFGAIIAPPGAGDHFTRAHANDEAETLLRAHTELIDLPPPSAIHLAKPKPTAPRVS